MTVRVLDPYSPSRGFYSVGASTTLSADAPFLDEALETAALPPGRLTVRARLWVSLADRDEGATRDARRPERLAFPLIEREVTVEATLDLMMPADAPPLTFVDPALRQKVRDSIGVDVTHVQMTGVEPPPEMGDVRIYAFDLRIERPPVAMLWDAVLRTPAGEVKMGMTLWFGGRPGEAERTGIFAVAPLPERVDVILRPATRAVVKELTLRQIWGEEVIIPDVPVSELDLPLPAEQEEPTTRQVP